MISEGVPAYTNVWDHKGPVIFWLNALAYSLFPTYSHAPSLLFFCLWVAMFWMVYFAFAPRLGKRTALGCLLGLFIASANSGGIFQNSVESSALFFSVAAVWNAFVDTKHLVLRHFLVGICVALSILVKPNLVAAGGALCIVWIFDLIKQKDWHTFILKGFSSFFGFAITLSGVSLYFWLCGSLYDFIDATLIFNLFEYTQRSGAWYSFWCSYFNHWNLTTPGAWILPTYLISLLLASFSAIRLYRQGHKRDSVFLGCWSLLEVTIALSSQTFYNHYLILSSLPIFLCITSIPSPTFQKQSSHHLPSQLLALGTSGWTIICVLLFSLCVRSGFRLLYTTITPRNTLNEWIRQNIPQSEKIVTWRGHPATEALCANKLFCQQKYLMQTSHYASASEVRRNEIKAEFLSALESSSWCFLDTSPEVLVQQLELPSETFHPWKVVYVKDKLLILTRISSITYPTPTEHNP